MDLIDEARTIQEEIDTTFTYAYECLQRANIENGISNVEMLAYTVPIENSITIQTRSIMGTESLMSNICLMPESQRIHLVRPVNRSIRREKHSAR